MDHFLVVAAAVLMALAVPAATFFAAMFSAKKSFSKDYVVSIEQRVTRLENDLKESQADLRLCDRERGKQHDKIFKLMSENLNLHDLLKRHDIDFDPMESTEGFGQ